MMDLSIDWKTGISHFDRKDRSGPILKFCELRGQNEDEYRRLKRTQIVSPFSDYGHIRHKGDKKTIPFVNYVLFAAMEQKTLK